MHFPSVLLGERCAVPKHRCRPLLAGAPPDPMTGMPIVAVGVVVD
jgi:hypothetical protein